jgi:hypothetical protein
MSGTLTSVVLAIVVSSPFVVSPGRPGDHPKGR